jgi:hypothetical protein
LQTKFDTQNAIKIDLDNRIRESTINLQLARKKTTGDGLYEPPEPDTVKANAKGEVKRVQVDYERMLSDVKKQIVDIHKSFIGTGEVMGKSPILLLDVSCPTLFTDHVFVYRKSNKPS